jgi:hypothetical protein
VTCITLNALQLRLSQTLATSLVFRSCASTALYLVGRLITILLWCPCRTLLLVLIISLMVRYSCRP